MLERIDLSKDIDKKVHKEKIEALQIKLSALQRQAKEKNLAIIIVFEGWDGAGKGTLINHLIMGMDARGYSVHTITKPTEDEEMRPYFYRWWKQTPAKGRIGIFDRCWHERVISDKDKDFSKEYRQSVSFEKTLTDGGICLIKFFLHISAKEQKRRLKKLLADKYSAWRVSKEDLKRNKKYNKYLKSYEKMLTETDHPSGRWVIVESENERFAEIKIYETVISAVENALKNAEVQREKIQEESPSPTPSILSTVDVNKTISKEDYNRELKKYQNRVREIEHELYMKRRSCVILYEGWDGAGKGGNIRRLVSSMDPRGYEVIPISAPNDIERAHHYLWRFWQNIPKAGHISIFDRTWYGRVLVERIEKFCTTEEYKRAYLEINEMEKNLSDFGIIIIKFWLHINKDEQLVRFKQREEIEYKKWKITDEDWRNREKWDDYEKAVDEMLSRTSTNYAPWTIVEANSKHFARIKALKEVIDTCTKHLEE